MIDIWKAEAYAKFLDARTKPAKDLLFAIPESFNPKIVYDLGCGPGNSTIILKERWSDAKVIGLDSSLDMLKEARITYPNIEFIEGDLASFTPKEKIDCIFANASIQWISEHDKLIPRLLSFLKPNGVLAIQIPNNFHHPSHQVTIRLLDQHEKWHHLLTELRYSHLSKPFYDATDYYNLFNHAGVQHIQLWETEYLQEMNDHQSIFDWVQGTGLRPILSKMEKSERKEFEKAYITAIEREYSFQKNGKILFPFLRLFMIAIV